MPPACRLTLLLPLLLAAAPTLAHAQTGDIVVSLSRIGDREEGLKGELAIGIAECEADDELEFTLDNVPTGKTTIEVYVGDDCTSTDRNNPELSNCERVAAESIDERDMFDLVVKISELVTAQNLDCDSGSKVNTPLWFLAVDTANSQMSVGTGFGVFPSGQVTEFRTDLERPEAPHGVSGGSGENQIPVDWDSNDTDLERFYVYADSNVGSGGSADGGNAECSSSRLRAGADASGLPDSLRIKTENEGTATGTTLGGGDIDGEVAAVAVVAVDTAGNESPLSEVVCVHVIPTDGFWDVYEREGGDVSTGCPCAAMGPAQVEGSLPIALSLGWLGVRRRRRRAR